MKKSLKTRLGDLIRRKERTAYYWKLRQGARKGNIWCWYRHRKLMRGFNADIPLGTQFDGVPAFPHGLNGIFISDGAKIGKNCVIFHQVTIGSNTLSGSRGRGAPVIGDNVYIGCGAKIIGGVRVGNNARIGAGCVVTRDVPDNATVVMEKPRVIVHETPPDNTFVGFNEMEQA